MSLIEDEVIPYEVYFDIFKENKVYDFVFYNFLNPAKYSPGTRGKGKHIEYYKWTVDSDKDYEEEGILKNLPFVVHISKQCFQRAYSKYKYLNFDFIKYLRNLETEEIDMIVRFKRINVKTMQLISIKPLYGGE